MVFVFFFILMGKYLALDKILDNVKRFTNGFITKFKHANTDHFVTMSLIFESSLLMLLISSIENSISDSDLSVIKGKSDGNMLPLSINEHCFTKQELKFSLFFLKSVINLLSRKSGGIQGIFLPFKRRFNKLQ